MVKYVCNQEREVITMEKYYHFKNLTQGTEFHFPTRNHANAGYALVYAIETGLVRETDKIQFCGKAVL